jgi:O-antigen biosynthesis alpha-1,2-rhamnosyltransferase
MPDPECAETELPRVWIDCTLSLNARYNTGVQRVVRLLCREALFGDHSELGRQFCPVVSIGDAYWKATMDRSNPGSLRLTNRPVRWWDDVTSRLPKFYRGIASYLCDRLRIPTLRRWLLPMPGHLGMFRLPAKLSERYSHPPPPDIARIEQGDLLLLPDSYWSRFARWEAIEAAKKKGVRLIFVLYDLIPYTHAELYDHAEVQAFRRYLERILELADGVIAISAAVANEFREFLRNHHPNRVHDLPVNSFPLGAEIEHRDGFIRERLRSLFGPAQLKTPYLMVGSIEVRKNHHYAIDAMEQVWQQHPDTQLLIVGRIGWQGRPVVERIKNHPQFNKRLHLLHDVTDAELNYCYANSRGILFPSLTEGFGLPIVEALWHGTQPFVSDIPSHREVGSNECFYCDVTLPDSLVRLIDAWENRWQSNRPIIKRHTNVTTWSQSFRTLMDRIG